MSEPILCKICNKTFDGFVGFSSHLRHTHNMKSKNYYDKYNKQENEGICPVCSKSTKFIGIKDGYQVHCSNRCTRLDPAIKKQLEETFLKKYGVPSAFNIDYVRESSRTEAAKEKRKQTNLERFGCEYQIASESTKAKCKQTNIERFGVDNPFKSKEFVEALKQKNLQEHGYEWHTQSEEFKEKLKSVFIDRYNVENPFQMNVSEMQEKAKETMLERYGVDSSFKLDWVREKSIHNHSKNESILLAKIKEFYSGPIKTNNIKLIFPHEVDLYFPELNLAIEYNGNYWHSYPNKAKDYHLKKSLLCRDKGIRLIHIYEFEKFETQISLLKDLILGTDNYHNNDFNKNNLLDIIPTPEIIYDNNGLIIYGAGKLYS